jgi:hypothetical protein
MAGIKITDLPSVNEVLRTDQMLIARGETTRKVFGTALTTKEDIADLTNIVRQLSSSSLIPEESELISLYYNPLTKRLSAEIEGVIPQSLGGTGYQSYTENQTLIADAYGVLRKFEFTAGRGMLLSADQGTFKFINTEPHIPTNLSATYVSSFVNLHSSTGDDTTIESSTFSRAGVMSSQDKVRLDDLFLYRTSQPLVFSNSITATSTLLSGARVVVIDSTDDVQITLPYEVQQGSAFHFLRANSGSVTFVGNPGVQISTIKNSSYLKIPYVNGEATAYFNAAGQWKLTGDLASLWDRTLTGPNSVDGEQKVGIFTNGAYDSIYYKNEWDKATTSFKSMVVHVGGIVRAAIDFTEDRLGKPFGYSIGSELGGPSIQDPGPTYFGTFTAGNVNLT